MSPSEHAFMHNLSERANHAVKSGDTTSLLVLGTVAVAWLIYSTFKSKPHA